MPLYVPHLPDTVWSADFMSDTLLNQYLFATLDDEREATYWMDRIELNRLPERR